MADKGLSRRHFLGRAAGATAAFTILPRHVLGGVGHTPPSERITHGIIGVGSMGTGHLRMVRGDRLARLVAVCDVDRKHLGRALKTAGKGVAGHGHYRELLDRRDVDVVHIVTPPHWHALMAVEALDAGHDVWCEKPMTRTIGEGRHVIDAVRRNGRVFRLNTWFRLYGRFYGMGCPVRPLKKLAMSGALGWPLTVRVGPRSGFNWKLDLWCGRTDLTPARVPEQVDDDLWLGPAPVKPYHPHRVHQSFRGYWDYDGGGLADMGQHFLDPVQYILDKDHTSPIRVEADAPWPVHPDAVGTWRRVEMEYADGCRIILETAYRKQDRERQVPFLTGPKGRVYPGLRTDPAGLEESLAGLPDPPAMVDDFNVSVRSRRRFGLHELNGNRSNLLVHLANAAIRTGRPLTFDPKRLRFRGDAEANRLIDQPMRWPWVL